MHFERRHKKKLRLFFLLQLKEKKRKSSYDDIKYVVNVDFLFSYTTN